MSVFDFICFAVKAGVVLQDPAAVDWAVWFHDAVYDPKRCEGLSTLVLWVLQSALTALLEAAHRSGSFF
jgi:predicted metal-dependent HD superfamily phosphohydrolase